MNIIEHTRTELGLKNIILRFSSLVGLSKLTKKANFRRRSSISLTKVLAWLIQTKFLGRSLYRAMPDPDCTIRTVRNDLNDGRINWQRLTCLVGAAIIKHLRPYIDARRRFAFILDDTLLHGIIPPRQNCLPVCLTTTIMSINADSGHSLWLGAMVTPCYQWIMR